MTADPDKDDRPAIKVEILPGIKITPQMLLSQVLADAEALRGVILITFEKDRGPTDGGYAEICSCGTDITDLSLAAHALQAEMLKHVRREG